MLPNNVSVEDLREILESIGSLHLLSNIDNEKTEIINSEIEKASNELLLQIEGKLSCFIKADKKTQNKLVAEDNGVSIAELINSPNYLLLFEEYKRKISLESLEMLFTGIENILLNNLNQKLKELNLDISINEQEVKDSMIKMRSVLTLA